MYRVKKWWDKTLSLRLINLPNMKQFIKKLNIKKWSAILEEEIEIRTHGNFD